MRNQVEVAQELRSAREIIRAVWDRNVLTCVLIKRVLLTMIVRMELACLLNLDLLLNSFLNYFVEQIYKIFSFCLIIYNFIKISKMPPKKTSSKSV